MNFAFINIIRKPLIDKQKTSITLENRGIGPALIEWIDFSYNSSLIIVSEDNSWKEVFEKLGKDCCNVTIFNLGETFIPTGQSIDLFWVDKFNAQFDKSFKELHENLGIRICYCSVYKDCKSKSTANFLSLKEQRPCEEIGAWTK